MLYRYRNILPVAGACFIQCVRLASAEHDESCGVNYSTEQQLTNWSSTHKVEPGRLYEPQNAQEVVRVLQCFHNKGKKIRAVGTALSPNGIGMSSSGSDSAMLSLGALDFIEVDKANMTVKVGAGATLGGWTQVSAHGTGISLPPVDEMIVHMQVATPTEGLLSLADSGAVNTNLFKMCKVGLGALGIVTEMTLKCIPQLDLVENTTIQTRNTISGKDNISHSSRLEKFRHVRYMWIPYTDTVVQVVSNPLPAGMSIDDIHIENHLQISNPTSAFVELLLQLCPEKDPEEANKLSFSQLRDELLDLAPLDTQHIRAVNAAEADFWKKSCGMRLDDSTNILGFDCGGEQWVLEVCFPIGTIEEQYQVSKKGHKEGKDITFVKKVCEAIESAGLPAPAPIEQRWTARSTAPLSPAYSENPDDIFSWVGVIMYMPPKQSEEDRQRITRTFQEYTSLLTPIFEEYGAVPHWAKIEVPPTFTLGSEDFSSLKPSVHPNPRVEALKRRLKNRYDIEYFNCLRRSLDPKNILSNTLIDTLLPVDDAVNPGPIWKKRSTKRVQK
eukprot:GSChrysophyteH1.ASY1.ANO1.2812.1 assembled CDS